MSIVVYLYLWIFSISVDSFVVCEKRRRRRRVHSLSQSIESSVRRGEEDYTAVSKEDLKRSLSILITLKACWFSREDFLSLSIHVVYRWESSFSVVFFFTSTLFIYASNRSVSLSFLVKKIRPCLIGSCQLCSWGVFVLKWRERDRRWCLCNTRWFKKKNWKTD